MSTVSSVYNYQYERNLQGLSKNSDTSVAYHETSSSSSATSATTSSGAALSSDSTDSSSAINQLLSTLMTLVMNISQGGSSDTASQENSQSETDYFNSLDTDSSGTLSQTEFTAARPDDVTEDMANNLFTQLDADGDGSLSTEELAAKDAAPNVAPPPPASEEESISSLDTDGDGVISQAEFLAGRPDEVTEEDATNLFSQVDSDGDGVVSEEELTASRQADKMPPPPAMSSGDSDSTFGTTGLSLDVLIAQLEEITKSYASYGSEQEVASQSITV